jgi:predicted nucleotide-binding protein
LRKKEQERVVPQPKELDLDQLQRGINRFEDLVRRLNIFSVLTVASTNDSRVAELKGRIRSAIDKTFETDSRLYRILSEADDLEIVDPLGFPSVEAYRHGLAKGRDRSIALLQVAIDDMTEDLTVELTCLPSARKTEEASGEISIPNTAFIVHGHDEVARETVRGFLTKLGVKAIILQEHANEGRTIIEKFEAKSGEATFAIILLTPDDMGGIVGGDQCYRARQNVILELGYFVGMLGRKRVCALKKGDIEVPTDYHGVAYVDLDVRGGWKLQLAQEMVAAGMRIDMNKAIAA